METMNSQLVEIASWRLLSELHRRHPTQFTVIATHPGGGQYDCLLIFDTEQRHIADFNRKGSLHVFETFDSSNPPGAFEILINRTAMSTSSQKGCSSFNYDGCYVDFLQLN
jgi:hypothetical protein